MEALPPTVYPKLPARTVSISLVATTVSANGLDVDGSEMIGVLVTDIELRGGVLARLGSSSSCCTLESIGGNSRFVSRLRLLYASWRLDTCHSISGGPLWSPGPSGQPVPTCR